MYNKYKAEVQFVKPTPYLELQYLANSLSNLLFVLEYIPVSSFFFNVLVTFIISFPFIFWIKYFRFKWSVHLVNTIVIR